MRSIHVELPAHLVEHVRHAVAPLGDAQRAVGQRVRRPRAQCALVQAEQLRDGDAAVDHVLALVARVVPAARHVERVVAGPAVVQVDAGGRRRVARREARDRAVAAVGGDVDVTGGAPVAGAEQRLVDRDAAALAVEHDEGVDAQVVVEALSHSERVGRRSVGLQHESVARRPHLVERDDVDVQPRRRVVAARLRLPLRDDRPALVQLPPHRSGRVGDERGRLGAVGQVADLVHANPRCVGHRSSQRRLCRGPRALAHDRTPYGRGRGSRA